jgi:hypothetical protein
MHAVPPKVAWFAPTRFAVSWYWGSTLLEMLVQVDTDTTENETPHTTKKANRRIFLMCGFSPSKFIKNVRCGRFGAMPRFNI